MMDPDAVALACLCGLASCASAALFAITGDTFGQILFTGIAAYYAGLAW